MAERRPKDESEEPDDSAGPATEPAAPRWHELWGIGFMAIGLLILIAQISWLANHHDNILGPWAGWMAIGLSFMFGTVPALFVPAGAMLFGWRTLRGKPTPVIGMIIWIMLAIELCALSAVRSLPAIRTPAFKLERNALGNLVSWLIYPAFTDHLLGPYLIFSLAIFMTLVFAFRIEVASLISLAGAAIGPWLARLREKKAPKPEPEPQPSAELVEEPAEPKPEPKRKRTKAVPAAGTGAEESKAGPAAAAAAAVAAAAEAGAAGPANAMGPEELDPEEDAKRQLEEELARFRAKKHEPIKITTLEMSQAPAVPEPEPDLPPEPEVDPEFAKEQLAAEERIANIKKGKGKGKKKTDSDDEVSAEEDAAPEETDTGDEKVEDFEPEAEKPPAKPYVLPSPDIISDPPAESAMIDVAVIEANSRLLEKTLMNFGVEGKVVNVSPGPVVTRYEIELAPGIKVSRVVSLQDDISMAVGGQKIRIQAPIPGKPAIGIELPNPTRQTVHFKHILLSEAFRKTTANMPIIIGKNISGMPYVSDVTKMPHLLIAGQTGSGKSVCINSIICSLLMTKSPEELRMIMIDPKQVELSAYQGIPHLLSPVVTESKEAVKALQWGVKEMQRRYTMFSHTGARNIESFNNRVRDGSIKPGALPDADNKLLPFIVIVIDELADLMMTASRDVEYLVQRVAQLARAVGIHLIVATQRPSVDIITGKIKTNLASRIAFRTTQGVDSKTILDRGGAEKLLGLGDMLFLRSGAPDLERYHGSLISEQDVEAIVGFIRSQYVDIERIESFEAAVGSDGDGHGGGSGSDDRDELFEEAARIIVTIGQGSTSLLQRRMKIGYARAGRLMDELEQARIVGPQEGAKMREVLIQAHELEAYLKGE